VAPASSSLGETTVGSSGFLYKKGETCSTSERKPGPAAKPLIEGRKGLRGQKRPLLHFGEKLSPREKKRGPRTVKAGGRKKSKQFPLFQQWSGGEKKGERFKWRDCLSVWEAGKVITSPTG